MQYNQKRQDCSVKEHNCGILPNLEYLECHTPLTACVFGGFSREKGILFIKKGIACG